MKVAQGQALNKFESVFKLFFALSRKSGQHIGPDCGIGKIGMEPGDQFSVVLWIIGTAHSVQDFRVSALKGNVEVAANPGS